MGSEQYFGLLIHSMEYGHKKTLVEVVGPSASGQIEAQIKQRTSYDQGIFGVVVAVSYVVFPHQPCETCRGEGRVLPYSHALGGKAPGPGGAQVPGLWRIGEEARGSSSICRISMNAGRPFAVAATRNIGDEPAPAGVIYAGRTEITRAAMAAAGAARRGR